MGRTKNLLMEMYDEEYLQDQLFLQSELYEMEQEYMAQFSRPKKVGKRVFSRKFWKRGQKTHKLNYNKKLPF